MLIVLLDVTLIHAQVSGHAATSTAKDITCPPGKHAYVNGSITTCELCSKGFFSASASSSKIDSCIAHTKCPPGKYTQTAGNVTNQPKCTTCVPGFYKNSTSISSTCAGASSRTGKSGYEVTNWRHASPTCSSDLSSLILLYWKVILLTACFCISQSSHRPAYLRRIVERISNKTALMSTHAHYIVYACEQLQDM